MTNRKTKTKDVLLDILAFVIALVVTCLIFLIYPLWLGIVSLSILTILGLGLFIDIEKLPKPIKAISQFLTGLCVIAFIVFIIGVYSTPDKFYLMSQYKNLNAGLALFSAAAYIFLYIRVMFHVFDREDKRREKEKAEKGKAYWQNRR